MVTARTERAASVGATGGQALTFRPEIQGLRAVAAGLVAIYHVWFDTVSGGVDVFFVVSGFLITGSLVRRAEHGPIHVAAYLRRIARRIVPSAYLVLAVTALGVLAVLSPVYWAETFTELAAAALYLANVAFALTAVDYLAHDAFASPVLHFWALSIQGQFYLLWPLVIAVLAWLARRLGTPLRRVALAGLLAIAAASLGYAIALTATDQAAAYFSMPARIWEFALGGVVALVAHRVRLPGWLAGIVATAALVVIFATGALLDVARLFPGVAALLPTVSAAAIILAGSSGAHRGGLRRLASRPMTALGDASYAFFLWHWPLLVLTLVALDVERLSPFEGAALLLVALALAVATTRLLEQPLRRAGDRRGSQRPLLTAERLAFAAVPLALAITATQLTTAGAIDDVEAQLGPDHPGATVLDADPPPGLDGLVDPDVTIVPAPTEARADRPAPYDDGCHQGLDDDAVARCAYGAVGAPTRVALVGGSHAAHWQPALDLIGSQRGWEVVHMTKSACRLGAPPELGASCAAWHEALLEVLTTERFDAVVTTATIGQEERDGATTLPEEYLAVWDDLAVHDVEVVALRDNPWWPRQVPACVAEHGPASDACRLDRDAVLAPRPPWENASDLPDAVAFVDLTAWLCPEGVCPAVVGNVLVYRDSHHLTVPYAQSLAPALDRALQEARPDLFGMSG